MEAINDVKDRLRASLRFDAINGDSHERAVVERQIKEACDYIETLESCLNSEGWVAVETKLPDNNNVLWYRRDKIVVLAFYTPHTKEWSSLHEGLRLPDATHWALVSPAPPIIAGD